MVGRPVSAGMSPNKKVIETYLASTDRSKVAPLLADDVEWVEWGDGVPPTGIRTRGKAAFIQNFGDDELRTQITRMTEENNVVVAEGTVRVHKKDGRILAVEFCNIFELENGKVKRLSSFGALVKEAV
jgi:ketosteroid isomerase-like protein